MKAKYAQEIRTGIMIGQEYLDMLDKLHASNYMGAMLLARTRLDDQSELTHRAFQRTLTKY
jgi:hypothetical protein